MSGGEIADEKSLAMLLREGAACALRALLAGNQWQIAAAETVLTSVENEIRIVLRHIGASQAEQEAETGVERARLVQALAMELDTREPEDVPEDLQRRLWVVAAKLQKLGPCDD